jgi:hypothetical protein
MAEGRKMEGEEKRRVSHFWRRGREGELGERWEEKRRDGDNMGRGK